MPAEPGGSPDATQEPLILVPYEPRFADVVASWATTPAEVRAWCARDDAPVPPSVVDGWAAAEDVEAWLLVDGAGAGVPVGYGELWPDPDAGEVELARLIVDPRRRGRGAGRRLARALADRARTAHSGLALVALRVLPGNEPALRAYAAAGFERVDAATEAAWNEGQPTAWWWMRFT